MSRLGTTEFIDAVVTPGTFRSWDADDLGLSALDVSQWPSDYQQELADARESTGHEESVVVGEADIDGHRCAFVVGDFDFLAGSVGRRSCELVIAAFRRAQRDGLPVVASPCSGGTRMQEGTAAFALMTDVALAVSEFRAAGGLVIGYLRHPTTGGVMATWGSLSTVTFGQPGALTGFLGPRVYEQLNNEPFPSGIQCPENLAATGVIDAVVEPDEFADVVARFLRINSQRHVVSESSEAGPSEVTDSAGSAWEQVSRTRESDRVSVDDLLDALADVVRLSGTGEGQRSDAVSVAFGRLPDSGQAVLIVGTSREVEQPIDPAGLQTARRAFAIGSELNIPVVTLIDTWGGELSAQAESQGIAGQIARTLVDLQQCGSVTVSVILGMGCGGAALALLPADCVLVTQSGWLAPLPIEGAAIIRYRTIDRAPELAEDLGVSARRLVADGVADRVIADVATVADCSTLWREVYRAVGEQATHAFSERMAARRSRHGLESVR